MTGAVEFLIVLLLLVVAMGQLFLFVLCGPVLRRMIRHGELMQKKLEEKAQEAIPAGVFRPVKRADGTVALMPADETPSEQSEVDEVVAPWLTRLGLI